MAAEVSSAAADLVVVSDLHLGEGLVGRPARYSPMEDFFYDEEFCRLLSHLRWEYMSEPSRLRLVLNGDIFDFLTVTTVPGKAEAAALNLRISSTERRFGLNPTPRKSVYKLDRIMDGHRAFFIGLAQFVAAGFAVELLPGNHDLELFFPEVRERLYARLAELPGAPPPAELRARLSIHPWFYLEEGRVYVEHGNQYEPSNSIRNPLRRCCPTARAVKARLSSTIRWAPSSSASSTTRSTASTPIPQGDLLRAVPGVPAASQPPRPDAHRRSHWPFFTRALSPRRPRDLRPQPAAGEPEGESVPAVPFFSELSALKLHPLAASKATLARQMVKPVLRRLSWVTGLSFVTLYVCWSSSTSSRRRPGSPRTSSPRRSCSSSSPW